MELPIIDGSSMVALAPLKLGSAPNPAVTAGMNPASTTLRDVVHGTTMELPIIDEPSIIGSSIFLKSLSQSVGCGRGF